MSCYLFLNGTSSADSISLFVVNIVAVVTKAQFCISGGAVASYCSLIFCLRRYLALVKCHKHQSVLNTVYIYCLFTLSLSEIMLVINHSDI